MTALHQKAVAFVQCALSEDTCGNYGENQETVLFIIGLIADHERQQDAAQWKEVKKVSSVAEVSCVDSVSTT